MIPPLRQLSERLLGWLRIPPPLPAEYDAAAFAHFMRREIFRMGPAYARRRVALRPHPAPLPSTGAVVAFLHSGSFFLSGLALMAHTGRQYTAVVTGRNLSPEVLGEADYRYWKSVHEQVSRLYSRPVFYSDAPPHGAVRWLRAGGLLGVALDVREAGFAAPEDIHPFRGARYAFPRGAARLAVAARVPLVPVSIEYCASLARHCLHVGPALRDDDPVRLTGAALHALDALPVDERQWFHSIESFRAA